MTQKKCIFCQGSGMSKEHFWPDWLRSYFKTTVSDKHIGELHVSEGKAPLILQRKKERSGNLITKKFRVVCKACNNGWMSQLEEKVKPILISILENKAISFDQKELSNLARWAVMKVIVAEQSEDGTQVTPEMDRILFSKEGIIPDYFYVFIGKHKSGHDSAYLRHSTTLALSKDGPAPRLNGMKRNTQTVSFLLGPLFVHVATCRVDNHRSVISFNMTPMTCIFPSHQGDISWQSLDVIAQPRMSAIANALLDITSGPMVKYAGPRPSD